MNIRSLFNAASRNAKVLGAAALVSIGLAAGTAAFNGGDDNIHLGSGKLNVGYEASFDEMREAISRENMMAVAVYDQSFIHIENKTPSTLLRGRSLIANAENRNWYLLTSDTPSDVPPNRVQIALKGANMQVFTNRTQARAAALEFNRAAAEAGCEAIGREKGSENCTVYEDAVKIFEGRGQNLVFRGALVDEAGNFDSYLEGWGTRGNYLAFMIVNPDGSAQALSTARHFEITEFGRELANAPQRSAQRLPGAPAAP